MSQNETLDLIGKPCVCESSRWQPSYKKVKSSTRTAKL